MGEGERGTKDRIARLYYRLYARYDAAAIANSLIGRTLLWTIGILGNAVYVVRRMERRPWFIRSSIRSVRHIMPEAKKRHEGRFPLPTEVTDLKDLRVACVADDFTELAYSFECQLRPLNAENWRTEIKGFHPHLLLVESTWDGKDDSWKWKVSVLSPELVELVHWCKRNGIPTVFWNKEDPIHFETFIRSAALFDVIFTTAIECIPDYRSRLGTGRVFLLPFAAQPSLHNPIEMYDRKDAFCFAGAYYTKQLERNKTFSRFVDTIASMGELEIFDRYQNTADERLIFPKVYGRYIRGTLGPDRIDLAYKSYVYGLNMNTIKQSESMFARRVYELLASNTVTLGNYSRGQRNLLGDLAVASDDIDWIKQRIKVLSSDREYREKYRLAGLREVMGHHTYRHRFAYMVDKVFDRPLEVGLPRVAVLSRPRGQDEVKKTIEMFRSQSYERKELWLVMENELEAPSEAHVISPGKLETLALGELGADHVALFDPLDYYGENYLMDLVLGAWWSGADAVGKRTVLSGHDAKITDPGYEYRFVGSLPLRSSLIAMQRIAEMRAVSLLEVLDGGAVALPICLSLDRFNYCRDADLDCPWADDNPTWGGLPIGEIYGRAEEGTPDAVFHLGRSGPFIVYGTFPYPNRADPYLFLLPRSTGYREAGLVGEVLRVSAADDEHYDIQGLEVNHLSGESLERMLSSERPATVHVHMLTPELWNVLKEYHAGELVVWAYGPETLPLERRGDAARARMWGEVLVRENTRLIFASRYLQSKATEAWGIRTAPSWFSVVPVPAWTTTPISREKRGWTRILCLRPDASARVDVDLLVRTIEAMAELPRFLTLRINIVGNWGQDAEKLEVLRKYANVQFSPGSSARTEREAMMASNDILLLPLLEDFTGSTLAEAMANGVVPAVTPAGAAVEVVDASTGLILGRDPKESAVAVLSLCHDPDRAAMLSRLAADRINEMRGKKALKKEMALFHKHRKIGSKGPSHAV